MKSSLCFCKNIHVIKQNNVFAKTAEFLTIGSKTNSNLLL